MRYNYNNRCNLGKVSRWHNNLGSSNLADLSELKHQAGISGFVAINAKPWGDSPNDISEIGVAFIPIIDIHALQEPLKSLKSLYDQFPIYSSRILVSGRPQRNQKKCEAYIFGLTETVEPEAVHGTLIRLFESFQLALGSKGSLTLIGFDLASQFRVLSNRSLGVTKYASSWVDIQEIVKNVSSRPDRTPSMRDSLIAFGFSGDRQGVVPSWMTNSAGMNALRIIALLVSLLAFPPDTTLKIHQEPKQKRRSPARRARYFYARNHFSCRPRPRECFPFRARVRANGGMALTKQKVFKSFSKYNPTAIGIHGGNVRHEGYVCLPGLEELNRFVEQVHGSQVGNGELWEAVSEFDPQLTTARTATELSEFLKAKSDAIMEQKISLRKQQKEKNASLEEECWDAAASLRLLELQDTSATENTAWD